MLEALRAGLTLESVCVQKGVPKGALAAILNAARDRGIPVKEAAREKLTRMAGIEAHQGVVAVCSAARYGTADDIRKRAGGDPLFLVFCDGIQDPRNLGAIIRTAEAAGVHGILIPRRRGAGLTAAAVKASAGAALRIPVVRVGSIVAAIRAFRKENGWVTCADRGGTPWCALDFRGKAGLVIGSEGQGVSRLVREQCDFVASLPMYGQINCLNASVAGGIILYEMARQRAGLAAR